MGEVSGNNFALEVPQDLQDIARVAIGVVDSKVRHLATNDPDFFPMFTEMGRWRHGKEAWTNWCDGSNPMAKSSI